MSFRQALVDGNEKLMFRLCTCSLNKTQLLIRARLDSIATGRVRFYSKHKIIINSTSEGITYNISLWRNIFLKLFTIGCFTFCILM